MTESGTQEKETILSPETRNAIVQLAGRLIEEEGIGQTEAIYGPEALDQYWLVFATSEKLAEEIREILASAETEPPSPSEVRDTIQEGSEYYPFGMSKLRFMPEISFAKTLDIVEGIKMMMERNAAVIAGNFSTNVRYNLAKRNKRSDNPRSAEEIDTKATENTRLMGIIDALLFEAMQDQLLISEIYELIENKIREDLREVSVETLGEAILLPHYYPIMHLHIMTEGFLLDKPPGNPKKVPTMPISEIAKEDEEFQTLHDKIKGLKKSDTTFRDMLYACTPRSELKTRLQDEPFDELPPRQQEKMNQLMEYAELEVTMILYFKKGVKLGHTGEAPYNKAAKYATEKFDLEEPQFIEVAPKGLDPSTLLYREYRPSTALKDAKSLTMAANWMDRADGERIRKTFQTHRLLLEKISKTDLVRSEEERQLLKELAVMHINQGMVLSLVTQCPEFADLFEKARITEVIEERIPISELEKPNPNINFSCTRREGESDPAYFTRFVAEIVQGQISVDKIIGAKTGMRKAAKLHQIERRASRIWVHALHNGILDPKHKVDQVDLEDAWNASEPTWEMPPIASWRLANEEEHGEGASPASV